MALELEFLLKELKSQGITHPGVLAAIKKVPREKFILSSLRNRAYDNTPLPIECEQTISQPYIVALMTQTLYQHPHPQKILEIGTGSGYQAAILATLFKEVYTIERIKTLSSHAQKALTDLGFENIHFKVADGAKGWKTYAPFDGILVTAASEHVPQALIDQLNPEGGILVIPIGPRFYVQQLTLITRQGEQIKRELLERVSFVPLIEDKM